MSVSECEWYVGGGVGGGLGSRRSRPRGQDSQALVDTSVPEVRSRGRFLAVASDAELEPRS